MEKVFLTAKELAFRWGVSLKTLRQWRSKNKGPNFFKISGRATYKLEDIEKFEESRGHEKIIKKKSEKDENRH